VRDPIDQPDTAEWWRDAVVYQIYIRSFADADANGVGDIAGIGSRLEYLSDLGVDAIWITPWYPSPFADGGYDVADYCDVAPVFGDLDQAEALIADVHRLGMRIILDLVPNHTSDHHRWFLRAVAADADSPERGWYWFRPGLGPGGHSPPNDWRSVFGGSAWERLPATADGVGPQWYLHLFATEQPDLNWANPEVAEAFDDVLRFWFDRGVDGFRIDVANALAKDPTFRTSMAPTQTTRNPSHRSWLARRRPTIRTGIVTRFTRSSGAGAASARAIEPAPVARECSWPRRGGSAETVWPAMCDPTSCKARSTSSS
jgi:alpha-glucosidase